MIVVLKEHPNEKQLDNLKAWLTSLGLRIHESEGGRTVQVIYKSIRDIQKEGRKGGPVHLFHPAVFSEGRRDLRDPDPV